MEVISNRLKQKCCRSNISKDNKYIKTVRNKNVSSLLPFHINKYQISFVNCVNKFKQGRKLRYIIARFQQTRPTLLFIIIKNWFNTFLVWSVGKPYCAVPLFYKFNVFYLYHSKILINLVSKYFNNLLCTLSTVKV